MKFKMGLLQYLIPIPSLQMQQYYWNQIENTNTQIQAHVKIRRNPSQPSFLRAVQQTERKEERKKERKERIMNE